MQTSTTRPKQTQGLAPLVLVAFLSACGGGTSGTSTSGTAPTVLSYQDAVLSLMLGVPMQPLPPLLEGDVTSWTVSPPLPAGLSIDGTTGAIQGTPTEASPVQTHTVTAWNGTASLSAPVALGVAGAFRHLLAGGDSLASVETYRIDARTGTPAHDGWFDLTGGLLGLASNPARPIAYAITNTPSARLQVLWVRAEEIEPTVVQEFNLPQSQSYGMAVDAQARVLVITAEDQDRLLVCPLSPDGRLSGSPQSRLVGDQPRTPAFTQDGEQLALADRDEDGSGNLTWGVRAFPIGTGGSVGLDPVHTPLQGFEPRALDFVEDALFLGVSGFGTHYLVRRRLVGGELLLEGDPGDSNLELVDVPVALAGQPTGRSVTVLLGGAAESLQRVSLEPTDQGFSKVGDPMPIGSGPADLLYDETGRFLFVSVAGVDGLLAFETDPKDGSLFSRGAFRTRSGARHLAAIVSDAPIQATVKGAYVSDRGRLTIPGLVDGMLHRFDLDDQTGLLSQAGLPTELGWNPSEMVVDPRGQRLFVLDRLNHHVFPVSLGADGAPSVLAPVVTELDPLAIALDPNGRVLYVSANGETGAPSLSAYRVEAGGSLTLMNKLPLVAAPEHLEVSPVGHWLLGVEPSGGQVLSFKLEGDGSLSESWSVNVLQLTGGPSDVVFSRSGAEVVVLAREAGMLHGYFLNHQTGQLVEKLDGEVPRTMDLGPLTDAAALEAHPFEQWIYVASVEPSGVFCARYLEQQVDLVPVGLGLTELSLSPLGKFLLSVDSVDKAVLAMTVEDGLPVIQSVQAQLLENPFAVRVAVSFE